MRTVYLQNRLYESIHYGIAILDSEQITLNQIPLENKVAILVVHNPLGPSSKDFVTVI